MDMKRILIASSFLFFCFLPINEVLCQEKEGDYKWITFKGTSTLTGYYSDRQSFGQEIPRQYLTWQFRGQLTLLSIPFSGSVMLSTMQSKAYQPMNHYSFQLDARSLLRNGLKVPGFKFLKHIETFEIGRTRPSWSKLILNGIMVNGVNTGVRFGRFSAGFTYGTSLKPVGEGYFWNQQYEQRMAFGRLGIGNSSEGSYIFVSALRSWDISGTHGGDVHYYVQNPDTFIHMADTFFIPGDTLQINKKAGESLLAGIEGGISMFKGKLKVQGELAGSANTSNIESEPLKIDALPDWVTNIYQPRLTTSLSYAGRLSSSMNLRLTKITASVNRVAPGYRSPGVPFMRQDYESFEIHGNQMLLKRKITIQPWLKLYRDNLSKTRPVTTETSIWGISATWRPLKLPWISVTYSPHNQNVKGEMINQKSFAEIITFSTGKNYVLKKKYNAYTGLTWSGQNMESKTVSNKLKYTGSNFTAQQTLMLAIPLCVQVSGGFYIFTADTLKQVSQQINAGATWYQKKRWSAGIGIRYTGNEGQQSRTGITANFSANLGKAGSLMLTAEPIRYRDLIKPELEYNQYIIRCSLITRF